MSDNVTVTVDKITKKDTLTIGLTFVGASAGVYVAWKRGSGFGGCVGWFLLLGTAGAVAAWGINSIVK